MRLIFKTIIRLLNVIEFISILMRNLVEKNNKYSIKFVMIFETNCFVEHPLVTIKNEGN
jgi:hypothetical protein